MSIYKDCDIRGIYGRELRADEVRSIGRALAKMCAGSKILVGGDVRLSTPELKRALIGGLTESGTDVIDLGMIPTPALYFALKKTGIYAGATVTASHNPPEYNGIKFMLGSSPVTRDRMDALHAIVQSENFPTGNGSVEKWDVTRDYMAFMEQRFCAKRDMHILVDAGSGAMSRIAPEVFRRAGYRVTELYCACDGAFPHRSPNPADYSCLGATGEAVRACGADMGVAFDGDGDRAVFLNSRGEPIPNEKSFSLLIRDALRDHPSCVVYDQKSSSIVRKTISECGGTPMPERSGHAFIKRRFLENRAAIAGEVSGHFFFGDLGYDDGLFAALTMADLIARSGTGIDDLTDRIILPPITGDIRIFCPYDRQEHCLALAERAAQAAGAQLSHLDGVRADFADGWFLMRKSVTAEQITLRAEAHTQARLEDVLRLVYSALPEDIHA